MEEVILVKMVWNGEFGLNKCFKCKEEVNRNDKNN